MAGEAFVDAGCALIGVTLDPAWRAGVVGNLRMILSQGGLLLDPPVPDTVDPAPVFAA